MKIEEEVLIEIRRVIRATQLGAKQFAREAGLSLSQLLVLQFIESRQECTPSDIARQMNLSQPTITALLDRLEESELVQRRRDAADRRQIWVALTTSGLNRLHSAPQSHQQRFVENFGELSLAQQEGILRALRRLAKLLDAAALDASPVLEVGRLDRDSGSDGAREGGLRGANKRGGRARRRASRGGAQGSRT